MAGGSSTKTVGPRVAAGLMVVAMVLLGLAPLQASARASQYKDADQKLFRLFIRANPRQVSSALFVYYEGSLTCTTNGGFAGSVRVRHVKVRRGRFRIVQTGSETDATRYRFVFQGRVRRGVVRGRISLYTEYRDGRRSYECWSGRGRHNPWVEFEAARRGRS
jgi:hypothetical protein